ncbi:DNA-binding protein [candidate division KSB1 bacterium]|nr:DNA-binding protein [candidate division KSB1 bacterium]
MFYLGNEALLSLHKIGFLCSRSYPATIVLKAYDWAVEQREKGQCIISGFHSTIERDVFSILLKGEQPVIMVLARGRPKRFPPDVMRAFAEKRLLAITPFDEQLRRPTAQTCRRRNELIVELADEIVIAYAAPEGCLARTMINSEKIDLKLKAL